MTFTISTDIDAPPATVWRIMSDVERWHEWTASITSVRLLGPGPFALGSRARVRQPRLPPATWEVTEVEEGRRFTWVSRSPGIAVTGRHEVAARGDGKASRVTLALTFAGLLGPLVGRLTRGITQRYIALEANGLKRRSEGL
ncbi:MAG TPA: SRPBCC family protein [Gemmatimonadales bacterium]|nr:SRPBCC family protein [Gemmatimonadales bacterium]